MKEFCSLVPCSLDTCVGCRDVLLLAKVSSLFWGATAYGGRTTAFWGRWPSGGLRPLERTTAFWGTTAYGGATTATDSIILNYGR